jgi:hypothetical protein
MKWLFLFGFIALVTLAALMAVKKVKEEKTIENKKELKSTGASAGKENAVRAAKAYLESAPFSRIKLIQTLEEDGYTNNEAVYAAEAVGFKDSKFNMDF